MKPETLTQPDAERAISTEAVAFRKRGQGEPPREFRKARYVECHIHVMPQGAVV